MARAFALLLLTAVCAAGVAAPAAPAAHADVVGRWGGPDGASAGVLVLHGGGWQVPGDASLDMTQPEADRYAAQGARVLNADYGVLTQALPDALAAFDALDAAVDGPLCIAGESSGGHLALMIATERPVACVIALGAPTDLVHLAEDGGAAVAYLGALAFPDLAAASPALRPADLALPILVGAWKGDPLVPYRQQERLGAAVPTATVVGLDGGVVPWVHGDVDALQLDAFQRREHDLLSTALGLPAYVPPTNVPPPPPPAPPTPPPPPAPAPPPVVAPEPPCVVARATVTRVRGGRLRFRHGTQRTTGTTTVRVTERRRGRVRTLAAYRLAAGVAPVRTVKARPSGRTITVSVAHVTATGRACTRRQVLSVHR